MPREIPATALDLIKRFEGYHRRLPDGSAAPYLCPAGVWTIGWGSTRGPDGAPIIRMSPVMTEAECAALLWRDVRLFASGVEQAVKVPLMDGQFGALVSFAYNLGVGALRASTLLRRLNGGDYQAAADQFGLWVNAGGRRLPGLVTRRAAERAMFLTSDPQPILPIPPQAKGTVLGRFLAAFDRVVAGKDPDAG
jgi:lysozyme